ncbi:MAG: hypothetical protein WC956_05950, partial [bacterium]
LATDMGLIEKSGAWYTCGEDRIGQGRDNARLYLKENQKLMARLEKTILEKHGIVKIADAAAAANAQTKEPAKVEAKAEAKEKPAK